jgi:hypothetical protein
MVLGAPFRVAFSAFKVTILTPNVSPETSVFGALTGRSDTIELHQIAVCALLEVL